MSTKRLNQINGKSGKNEARNAARARGRSAAPKPGSRVTVTFGRRDVDGVVIGKTITGRYSVELSVPGADDPVTTTYELSEFRLAN